MLMLGDSAATRSWFIVNFVPEIIDFILTTWESFLRDPSLKREQRITNLFSNAIERAYEEQGRRWFVVPEMQRTDPRTGKELVRHDIRFFHRDVSGQRLYFIFECKRLNVVNKRGTTVPNSAGYRVGMLKFVSGTYGAGHPCGGMIGYVMDGDVPSALITITKLIRKHRIPFLLIPGSDYQSLSVTSKNARRGETKHQRSDGTFVIHHLLLPLN